MFLEALKRTGTSLPGSWRAEVEGGLKPINGNFGEFCAMAYFAGRSNSLPLLQVKRSLSESLHSVLWEYLE